jgi:hypothetical protein
MGSIKKNNQLTYPQIPPYTVATFYRSLVYQIAAFGWPSSRLLSYRTTPSTTVHSCPVDGSESPCPSSYHGRNERNNLKKMRDIFLKGDLCRWNPNAYLPQSWVYNLEIRYRPTVTSLLRQQIPARIDLIDFFWLESNVYQGHHLDFERCFIFSNIPDFHGNFQRFFLCSGFSR